MIETFKFWLTQAQEVTLVRDFKSRLDGWNEMNSS